MNGSHLLGQGVSQLLRCLDPVDSVDVLVPNCLLDRLKFDHESLLCAPLALVDVIVQGLAVNPQVDWHGPSGQPCEELIEGDGLVHGVDLATLLTLLHLQITGAKRVASLSLPVSSARHSM